MKYGLQLITKNQLTNGHVSSNGQNLEHPELNNCHMRTGISSFLTNPGAFHSNQRRVSE